jgi:hypothetical protein
VFTATYSDAQGYTDIGGAFFMVAPNIGGVNGCFVAWLASGSQLYLGTDAGTGWLGPIQAGSNSTLQNSQCTLNASTTTASGSGNTLTVHFALSFTSGYVGAKNLYEMVEGSAGATSWQQQGTWTTGTPPPPTNVSISPSSGGGASQVFTATYSDTAGYQDISNALFMMAANTTGANGCFVLWQQSGNELYLGTNAGTGWLGPIQAGGNSTLQNSQCTLNASTTTASGSGNALTVHFGLTFANTYTGSQNMYLMSYGSGGINGWQLIGTWTP